ncbi:MAG: hypothetical protein Q8N33_14435 [Rhodocyclaceae bacterium]|nr:hypothetical protein [Rhodocyclaceae bacterium]
MASKQIYNLGTVSLVLSALTFLVYFMNVVQGGLLGRKPWMSDLGEMLTLFVAVIFFVLGAVSRESQAKADAEQANADKR